MSTCTLMANVTHFAKLGTEMSQGQDLFLDRVAMGRREGYEEKKKD